jgi:hypothetical protein
MDHPARAAGSADPGRDVSRLRLSVALDGRLAAVRAVEVAHLVGRLGLDSVWCRQPPLIGPADVPSLLRSLGAAGAGVGVIVDADLVDPGPPAGLPDDDLAALVAVAGIRVALAGSGARVAQWVARMTSGPTPFTGQIALPLSDAGMADARQVAMFVPLAPGRDLGLAVSGAAAAAAGRPVLVEVPISVGRTAAEAHARADSDDLFALVGHPAQVGLFGTLEQCQAGAARLAHAGATELICYPPHSGDLTDVLAQLRAIAVGASVLRPGEPPSSPPPPPNGWGGRRPAG